MSEIAPLQSGQGATQPVAPARQPEPASTAPLKTDGQAPAGAQAPPRDAVRISQEAKAPEPQGGDVGGVIKGIEGMKKQGEAEKPSGEAAGVEGGKPSGEAATAEGKKPSGEAAGAEGRKPDAGSTAAGLKDTIAGTDLKSADAPKRLFEAMDRIDGSSLGEKEKGALRGEAQQKIFELSKDRIASADPSKPDALKQVFDAKDLGLAGDLSREQQGTLDRSGAKKIDGIIQHQIATADPSKPDSVRQLLDAKDLTIMDTGIGEERNRQLQQDIQKKLDLAGDELKKNPDPAAQQNYRDLKDAGIFNR